MPTKLFTEDNTESFKSRLSSIIEIENKDNLQTHYRQVILLKDQSKVSGAIENNEFKIWTQEQSRRGVMGVFYPIVIGQFRPLTQGLEIEFKFKMNIIGKIIFLAIGMMLAYGIITGIVIQANNEMRFVIPRLLIGTVLFGLIISGPTYIYLRASKIIKKYLIKELGLRHPR